MTERNIRIRSAIDSRSSQQKVADRLGISRQAVNLRLSGEKDIDSIEFVDVVCELTGFSRDYLIDGTDESMSMVREPDIKYFQEVESLRAANRELQIKYDALLEAFERIGIGQKSSDRYVGQ